MNNLDEMTWHEESAQLDPDSEQQRQEVSISEKFRGYEIFLDAKPDPFMFEPVGETYLHYTDTK